MVVGRKLSIGNVISEKCCIGSLMADWGSTGKFYVVPFPKGLLTPSFLSKKTLNRLVGIKVCLSLQRLLIMG